MCEYVDHLHEHFTSPVVIHDAHYMPPKVRGAADGSYKLLNQSLHLKKKKKANVSPWAARLHSLCFLFSGSRIFLRDAGIISEEAPVP